MRDFPPPVRQPPPPAGHRRRDVSLAVGVMGPKLDIVPTLMANKEARNSKVSSTTNYLESLPEELESEILLHLGAEDIFKAAMVVCRKWYRMIHTHNFIYSHLQNSTPGILIKYSAHRSYPVFVSMVKGKIEISKIDYEYRCRCWSSCNGLTLEYHPATSSAFCILNPVTKQLFELPPFGDFDLAYCACSGIAYAAASMEYKVVCISGHPDQRTSTPAAMLGCAILTVGVDKSWRRVDVQHLSLEAKELFKNTPLTTEGFLHWTSRQIGMRRMLTLNVETEIITETRVPRGGFNNRKGKESRYYLSNGRSLSVVIACSEFSWDVWELKKPKIGEWVKTIRIDLEGQKSKFENLRHKYPRPLIIEPVAWLNYDEGLLVRVLHPDNFASEDCFVYNVGKQEIEVLDLTEYYICTRFLVHKNSLVWLDTDTIWSRQPDRRPTPIRLQRSTPALFTCTI
ncbi:hypothetical protein MIMGU_mgv1a006162mg [Erythranthe guttata]|uniref:F-box domain-containing protein n=1 Tax=Erythranthe guttata TaxID=4155 RepID=A0A022QPL9_ERYGU|nr:PREDICTED: uncharacterized protein LOC105967276 [Erythranthe guttata]EYU29243.1 hypothetical protein MIMGU_mgv1a006162mg [Erythranthe guttata]|eukprot:XP_012847333.1 PREDICTED: uncharacterized protein LOC105967276 [Erythranthe guttata]